MLLYGSAFLIIFCIGLSATDDNTRYPTEGYFSPEEDCSRSGGLCVLKELCPDEKKISGGNCPKQENLAAVCCLSGNNKRYKRGISSKECTYNLGACMKWCNPRLWVLGANCPSGRICCVLV